MKFFVNHIDTYQVSFPLKCLQRKSTLITGTPSQKHCTIILAKSENVSIANMLRSYFKETPSLRFLHPLIQNRFSAMASMNSDNTTDMFRPPISRTMQVLDRSFFKKTVSISAAKVHDQKQISRLRSELQKDMLSLARISIVQKIPEAEGHSGKALLLKPDIKGHGNTARVLRYIDSHLR